MDVVVAPHFDDAAFSAVGVLTARGSAITVLTVCAGAPAPGLTQEWDLACGFASGAAAAAARAAEDLRANALAGVRSVHLALTDAPYRQQFPLDQVIADLARELPATGQVWVPAGIGSHPDHVGTRDAVLALIPSGSGRVSFYADCPYAFAFGWDAADTDRDDEHQWHRARLRIERYLGAGPASAARRVLLSEDAMTLKLDMLRCHESQLRAMEPEFPGLLEPDGPMRTEMYWTPAVPDSSEELAPP